MAAVSGSELEDFDPFIRGLDAGPPRDEFGDYHLMDEGRLVSGLIERAVYSEAERRHTAEVVDLAAAGNGRQTLGLCLRASLLAGELADQRHARLPLVHCT